MLKSGQKVRIVHNSYSGRWKIGHVVFVTHTHTEDACVALHPRDEYDQIYKITDLKPFDGYANEEPC